MNYCRLETADWKLGMESLNTCPRCGAPFHCSKSSKCWCFDFDVSVAKREEIESEYDGCLCPACLKEFSQ